MQGTPVGESPQIITPVSCIAVLPAIAGADEESSIPKNEVSVLRKGARLADMVLLKQLEANENVKFVSDSALGELDDAIEGGLGTTIDRVGEEMNCDAVLVTTIRRFKQRVGGEYGVDEPASAAFDMRLFSTRSKNVVWAADFNETQESLLSNIFSFGKAESRGFKWITVEDLVTQAIKERIAECPYM
jgi:hypothetical protein